MSTTTVQEAHYSGHSGGNTATSQNQELQEQNHHIRRAGPFLLGPKLGGSKPPVKCLTYRLARKEGTNQYYGLKILVTKSSTESETLDDVQGKALIAREHLTLKALTGEPGVVQQHGLFKLVAMEEVETEDGRLLPTGHLQTQFCLVLDCYAPHEFCPGSGHSLLTNTHEYVMKRKGLPESEAVDIFFKALQIVERLHKRNIVHRDLKLGNMILNLDTREVKLANFWLAKQLASEADLLTDGIGSPAYVAPELIGSQPFLGKPADMWALGVSFYTMLCGQLPFYDKSPAEVMKKIRATEFHIPTECNVSPSTAELIQSLLALHPAARLTASQTVGKLRRILAEARAMRPLDLVQVVPNCSVGPERTRQRKRTDDKTDSLPAPPQQQQVAARLPSSTSTAGAADGFPEDEDYESFSGQPDSHQALLGSEFLKHLTSMVGESQAWLIAQQWRRKQEGGFVGGLGANQQNVHATSAAAAARRALPIKKRRSGPGAGWMRSVLEARVPSRSPPSAPSGLEPVEEEPLEKFGA